MVVIILCLVLTFVGVLLVFVLRLIPDSYCSLCRPIANIVRWILRFIPNYSFGEGMYAMTFQVEIFNVPPFAGETFGECYTAGLFFLKLCWGGVADQVVMMTILTFVYMAGIIGYDLAMQVPKVRAWFTVKKPVAVTELALEDDDVVAEQRRVKEIEGEKAHQILWVRNLRKAYSRSVFGRFSNAEPFHAVKDVSFAASEGQVFGLLGANGAGKTTTFKMLCAEYTPSGGDVWIQGHSVIEEPGVCRKMIGYCPQFDAIWDLLTVQEHLTLYAKLKGISRRNVKEAVNEKITELDLERYRNARAGSLSGGNKRKLSVAMALMGEPPMVFLDEPSSGMDPMARRFMWDVVQRIAERRKKSVVILSTHSMEEAEALCSRIAIQVDGQFRCLGSSQQIKTRYGDGFEAVIKFKTISSEEVAKVLAGWAVGERLTLSKTMEVIEDKIEPVSIKPGRIARAGSPEGTGPLSVMIGAGGGSKFNIKPTDQPILGRSLAQWVLMDNLISSLEGFLEGTCNIKSNTELSQNKSVQIKGLVQIEQHGYTVRYRLPRHRPDGTEVKIGELFVQFQAGADKLRIEDFQISQSTLEQIFNMFAATAKAPSPDN